MGRIQVDSVLKQAEIAFLCTGSSPRTMFLVGGSTWRNLLQQESCGGFGAEDGFLIGNVAGKEGEI